MPQTPLFRLDNTLPRDPSIDAWLLGHHGELAHLALHWFSVMRNCGDEVRELFHDGCPTACCGNFPFAYVNIFAAHANVGFFRGAHLPDPDHLLEGAGKSMRHVKLKPGKLKPSKLKPGASTHPAALHRLIQAAYADIKSSVETR
jgi:hypothetical protein